MSQQEQGRPEGCTCEPVKHPMSGEIHTPDCALVQDGKPARWVYPSSDQPFEIRAYGAADPNDER